MSLTKFSWSAKPLIAYLYSTVPVKSGTVTEYTPSPSSSVMVLYTSFAHHPHHGPVTNTSVKSVGAHVMSTLNVTPMASPPVPPVSQASQLL